MNNKSLYCALGFENKIPILISLLLSYNVLTIVNPIIRRSEGL